MALEDNAHRVAGDQGEPHAEARVHQVATYGALAEAVQAADDAGAGGPEPWSAGRGVFTMAVRPLIARKRDAEGADPGQAEELPERSLVFGAALG